MAKSMTPPQETFFLPTYGLERGSHPSLTTRDGELVSHAQVFGKTLVHELLLLLLKKIGNARLGEGDCHPISPKTPAPHYQPIEEKKRKGK